MEKRAILAAVLMAALLIIYQTFLLPTPAPPPKGETQPAPPPSAVGPEAVRTLPPLPAPESAPRPPEHTVTVDTPLYHAVVSSEGGKLQEWTLHYRGEKPLVASGELGPRGLALARPGVGAEPLPFHLTGDS